MIITGATISGARVVDGSILTQNLAIWIDANNASSYPGTGTTVTDLSGNGRTQNLGSAAQYTVLNGVKCFDCNSNSLTAASAVPTLPTTGFTYISWARMKSSTADWRTLFRTTPNDHPILVEIGSNRLGMYDNTVGAFFPAGYDVSGLANVWAQWVVTGDSSGQTLKLALGGAGSEVDKFLITPGGNGKIKFRVPSGSRVSIKAVSATASTGEIDINFFG